MRDRNAIESTREQRLTALMARLRSLPAWEARLIDGPLSAQPFTSKADLRAAWPLGLLAVPTEEVLRVHASSGTTGDSTVVPCTRGDLDRWAAQVARGLEAVGLTADSRVYSALSYGLFTGGFGFHAAAESLGAMLIPAASGTTTRQLQLLEGLGADVLFATPSFALHLAERLEATGVDPRSLGVRTGVFGAEPWSEGLRARIEARWGMTAYDTYGLSEVCGPGVAWECEARDGMHINEDHLLPEVIGASGEALPHGEIGELVLTTLTREALPLLRYRTGDRTRLLPEPCACGRALVRMARPLGRVDDMVIVRGVNVFPSQIEEVLLSFSEVGGCWRMVLRRDGALDEVTVEVESTEHVSERLEEALRDALAVRVRVSVWPPGILPRSEGKAQRVLDQREH